MCRAAASRVRAEIARLALWTDDAKVKAALATLENWLFCAGQANITRLRRPVPIRRSLSEFALARIQGCSPSVTVDLQVAHRPRGPWNTAASLASVIRASLRTGAADFLRLQPGVAHALRGLGMHSPPLPNLPIVVLADRILARRHDVVPACTDTERLCDGAQAGAFPQ
jgi:hypothetical protein